MENWTPSDIRGLADENERDARTADLEGMVGLANILRNNAAAQRSAAEQLEAVRNLTFASPMMMHPITDRPVDVIFVSDLPDSLIANGDVQDGRNE